jgi:flagellin-like hook-associated protein FlgL
VNQQLAFYGTTQDNLQSAATFATTQQTQLQAQIGTLQDANESAVIEDMTQAQTQLQAALSSKADIPKTTLFDFMSQ